MKRWPEMNRERWIFLLLMAFGVMAVTSSYTSLSETDDELFHISCGMQWWKEGRYTIQALHPPMARAMDAMLIYFRDSMYGAPLIGGGVERSRGMYITNMVLSRLGSLPYYIFSCVLVWAWARKLFNPVAALWALAVYVTLSSVTAHAMLATTDIGYTSMFLWALYVSVLWLEAPTGRRSFWLGASLALMVGTKFSGLMHWPLAMAAIMMAQVIGNYREGRALSPIGRRHLYYGSIIVAPCFVFVLWLVYRCDFGPFFLGLDAITHMNDVGAGVWFYGPLRNRSAWNFFPVVFFYKTPLTLFVAAGAGIWLSCWGVARRHWSVSVLFPLLAAVMIMLSSMTSHINLGVRHVLPLYPLLAIPAGYGLWWMWQGKVWAKIAVVLLALAQFVGFCMYHSEHIAYFNTLAGAHPERITLDSDYDWGQEMLTLDEELQKRAIPEVFLCARRDAVWSSHFVVRAKVLDCPKGPVTGWIAVARAWRLLNPDNFTWLARIQGVEKIGKTMDLYYIAPPRNAPKKPPEKKPAPPGKKPGLPAKPQGAPKPKPPARPLTALPTNQTLAPVMSLVPRKKPSLSLPQAKP